jgi:cobalt/nickel transport system ATP-binding protein
LEWRDVSFWYREGSLGLESCSLSIERSSRTAVLGANGAGSTILFLHVNGIVRPQSGDV